MQTYLLGDAARDYIRSRGVALGNNALKDHRSRGTGPRYVVINGRCCYTKEWCDEWIEAQASRPVVRRGRAALRDQSAA